MRPVPFKGNIIIWNIPDDFTEGQLAALFDDYGLVLGAKIDRFPYEPGRTARGLVDLAPAKAIDAAIEALDGSRVDTHKLKVRRVPEAAPKPPKAPKPRPAIPAAAYVAPSSHAVRPTVPAAEVVSTPVAPRKPVVEYLNRRKFALPAR
jgi:hypothetical protein